MHDRGRLVDFVVTIKSRSFYQPARVRKHDSDSNCWSSKFAKQGQVLQVGSIPCHLCCRGKWPAKVRQEDWNYKGWSHFIQFLPIPDQSRTTWTLTGNPWKCPRKIWTLKGKATWSSGSQSQFPTKKHFRFQVLDDDGRGKVEHLGSCALSIGQVGQVVVSSPLDDLCNVLATF